MVAFIIHRRNYKHEIGINYIMKAQNNTQMTHQYTNELNRHPTVSNKPKSDS